MSAYVLEASRWILLPIVAVILGSVFSSRPTPQWARSLAIVVVAVGGSIVLLSSATAALRSQRLSYEQSQSRVKYETYVSHSHLAR